MPMHDAIFAVDIIGHIGHVDADAASDVIASSRAG